MALIFNHNEFDNEEPRLGSECDEVNIKNVLLNLSFEVKAYKDLTFREIKNILQETADLDHSDNDCLVVVLMSHGNKGELYAKDRTYPVACLWENFLGNDCKSLIGKPKLFFIQACRGSKVDPGIKVCSRDVPDSPSTLDDELNFKIPTFADLLVMHATYDDHCAWRNEERGSWFIQSICREFEENGKELDLLTLLTGVSRRVAFYFTSNVPEKKRLNDMKQMPCIVSMLTKTLFFREK